MHTHKYEEFLSFGSKSPRVARQYCRFSSEFRSQVSSGTSPKMACANSVIYGHIARVVRINVSHETGEANVIEGQSYHVPSLPQLQITGGSQQPVKRNGNAERRQRHHARRQQMQEAEKNHLSSRYRM